MAEVVTKVVFFQLPLISGNFNHHNQHRGCFFPKKSESNGFFGVKISLKEPVSMPTLITRNPISAAQVNIGIRKGPQWWEKGLQPNMKEVTGAQDLVDSLLSAADKLVVVDFFSPGCGGCRSLHPKICQFAEMNSDVQFLNVNYEEHKPMCYSLNVHVLPFFRFYRGAEGRLCSFSCTNATIKKFKDALKKYGPDCCTLGPAKGLEEKELLALAANKDISFVYASKTEEHVSLQEDIIIETIRTSSSHPNAFPPLPLPIPLTSTPRMANQDSKSEAS